MIVVVGEAEIIRGAPFAVNPSRVGVQALRACSTCKRRKRSDDIAGRLRPIHSQIEVVLRSSPPATASGTASSPARPEGSLRGRWTKIVDEPQVHGVGIALRRSHFMIVLRGARQIRQRNVIQKCLGLCSDQRWIHHVKLAVEIELLPVRRVVDGRRQRGEIAATFGRCGYGGKHVGWRISPRSAPACEEKCLSTAIVNLGNIQRAANVRAKMELVVIRARQRISVQRVWPRIESGRIIVKIQVAVRLIHIEAAAQPPEGNRPTAAWSAAKSASSARTSTALSTESQLLSALAEFLNAVLEIAFAAAAKILGAALHAADAHRFCRSVGACAIQRQARQIAAASVLSCAYRQTRISCPERRFAGVERQRLEAAPGGSGGSGGALRRLFLLSRRQDQLQVGFSGGIFGIQYNFLREDGKSHELGAQHISSAGQSCKSKSPIGIGCRRVLLSCQRVRRGQRNARQRALAAMNAPSNLISRGLSYRRIFLPTQRCNYSSHHPQKKKSPDKKYQCGGSGGFCG